jgi:Mg-chelatase subunit ChlD
MKITLLTALLLTLRLAGQNSTIEADANLHDYGELENIYTLRSDFVLKNNAQKTLFLMRADVDKDVKVLVYKKAIQPGDTAHLAVFYQPVSTGKFKREIKLVTSADGDPYLLAVKGNIKSIKNDDKTACFYFKKPNRPNHNNVVIAYEPPVVNQQPVNPIKDLDVEEDTAATQIQEPEPQPEPEVTLNNEPLNRLVYKPNNIVFLADVSGSMRDSSKLPLMKKALDVMIDNLRDVDQVTFITYSDSVVLRCEAVKGSDKELLKKTVRSLKADGYTRGAKAVLYALETAKKNYIESGNNQVFLATDGKFPFYETHYKKWLEESEGKDIVLTAVALGNDKDAMVNLKEIARFGKGSFIRIRNFEKDKEALVEEIKLRSKKD